MESMRVLRLDSTRSSWDWRVAFMMRASVGEGVCLVSILHALMFGKVLVALLHGKSIG